MRCVSRALLALMLASTATPVFAQGAIEGRVDRLEREMRAVQRKVFPGGSGQFFQPDISAPDTPQSQPGMPATSPVADLSNRVASLENQVTQVTGQVEQTQNRVRQLEDAFAAYKRSTDARLSALEQTASTPGAEVPGSTAPPRTTPRAPAGTRPPTDRPTTPPATGATPSRASRAAEVAAVERPSTGDAAEDAYTYGFRLWQAKLHPEAQAAFKDVVAKYPNHRRASYAQNLLGRSYLDENKPSVAAIAFYQNYRTNPRGERAAESLYYLAQSLVKLKKPASEVCKVYDELEDVYGTTMSAQLKADTAKGKAASNCR